MMSYLYGEWRIREKERKAKERREKIIGIPLKIVESIRDSAFFYNRKWRKKYVPSSGSVQETIRMLQRVLAALAFFAMLVVGLNMFAVLV